MHMFHLVYVNHSWLLHPVAAGSGPSLLSRRPASESRDEANLCPRPGAPVAVPLPTSPAPPSQQVGVYICNILYRLRISEHWNTTDQTNILHAPIKF